MIFLTTWNLGNCGVLHDPKAALGWFMRGEQSEARAGTRLGAHWWAWRTDAGWISVSSTSFAPSSQSGGEVVSSRRTPPRYRGLGPRSFAVARCARLAPDDRDGRSMGLCVDDDGFSNRVRRHRSHGAGGGRDRRGVGARRRGEADRARGSVSRRRTPSRRRARRLRATTPRRVSAHRRRRGLAQRPGAPITSRPCSVPSRDETRRPRISPPARSPSTSVRGSCGGACSSISSASNSVTRARWNNNATLAHVGAPRSWIEGMAAGARLRRARRHQTQDSSSGRPGSKPDALGVRELTASDAGRPGR